MLISRGVSLISLNIKEKKRRGVAQIVGTLFMLAVVTVVGSVLFIQGISGITDFNTFLAIFAEEGESENVHEAIILEHVRFDPTGKDVDFWLRNTGLVTVGIDRITMVRVDTQELIINEDLSDEIFGKEIIKITITATLPTLCDDWSSTNCNPSQTLSSDEYRISVTSGRGNSFETTATPFNT